MHVTTYVTHVGRHLGSLALFIFCPDTDGVSVSESPGIAGSTGAINLSWVLLLQQDMYRLTDTRGGKMKGPSTGADLGILVGGVDIICNTYTLSATPFLQISLSAG